jgi:hypothetical protein
MGEDNDLYHFLQHFLQVFILPTVCICGFNVMLMEPEYCSHHSDWAVGLMIWGPNPSSDKRFFCSPEHPDQISSPSSLLFKGCRVLSLG